jgi:hypothetical protein
MSSGKVNEIYELLLQYLNQILIKVLFYKVFNSIKKY